MGGLLIDPRMWLSALVLLQPVVSGFGTLLTTPIQAAGDSVEKALHGSSSGRRPLLASAARGGGLARKRGRGCLCGTALGSTTSSSVEAGGVGLLGAGVVNRGEGVFVSGTAAAGLWCRSRRNSGRSWRSRIIGGRKRTRSRSETLSALSGGGAAGTSLQSTASPTSTTNSTSPTTSLSGSSSTQSLRGRVRSAIFPIYGRAELSKFLALGGVKFFIIFVLTLTRDLKDTLIVTNCGAESISFLKVYGVLPAAAAFMLLYSRLSSSLSKRKLFYVTAAPFFAFFLCFNFLIHPNLHILHPASVVLPAAFPKGLTYLTSLAEHWCFALFYIMAELYSSVSIGVLFWQFANDVVPVDQAKRFYPLFGQMSSLAPIAAGQCVVRFATRSTFDVTLKVLTGLITFSGAAMFSCYELSNRIVAKERRKAVEDARTLQAQRAANATPEELFLMQQEEQQQQQQQQEQSKRRAKKPKLGMSDSFAVLSKSPYLRCLAVLVLGYGLSINLTEVMWKSMLRLQYPNAVDYQRFMGGYSSIVGLVTFTVIFAGSNIIKHMGWEVGALATPVMMAVLALPVFATVIGGAVTAGGAAALKMAVMVGAAQSILSKATKYALFDPTTQMAYIPLDEESKVKGKAAIDGLGSRVGKSGGALIQQGLVLCFGGILQAAPALAAIFYGVIGAWVVSARRLAVMFRAATEDASAASTAAAAGSGGGDGSSLGSGFAEPRQEDQEQQVTAAGGGASGSSGSPATC